MSELVNQPSAAPTPKWVAGVGTAQVVVLVVWAAGQLGIDLTPEVAGELVVVAGGAVAYLKRNPIRRPRGNTPGTNGIGDHAA